MVCFHFIIIFLYLLIFSKFLRFALNYIFFVNSLKYEYTPIHIRFSCYDVE